MHTAAPRIDTTKILTRRELVAVLADLGGKTRRSARQNLILVRLACCCGLRVSESAALRVSDVRVEASRPHLRIRPGILESPRAADAPARGTEAANQAAEVLPRGPTCGKGAMHEDPRTSTRNRRR